jgi:lipopolysaccharide/colanic/teichoic acid biosynthesis glycosyltransferase
MAPHQMQAVESLPALSYPVALGRSHALPLTTAVSAESRAIYQAFLKPLFDYLAAFAGLVLALPVLALVALIVRIDLGRGVIFRQHRVGLRGQEFTVLKFRTMRNEVPDGAPQGPCPEHGHKCPNDPRHTKIGKLLRKLSLDELPQLINVLRGEMSLVGPRPELPEIVARYEPWQHVRHLVKPGLTGLWQVSERGSGKLMWQSTGLDVEYVHRISMRTDLSILLRTVPALLGRNQGH